VPLNIFLFQDELALGHPTCVPLWVFCFALAQLFGMLNIIQKVRRGGFPSLRNVFTMHQFLRGFHRYGRKGFKREAAVGLIYLAGFTSTPNHTTRYAACLLTCPRRLPPGH
jgi:hypothetical protein